MSFLSYILNHLAIYVLTLAFCETLGLEMLIGQTKDIKNEVFKPIFIGGIIFITIFIALLHLLAMSIFYNMY